jgi:hypothetical protein
VQFINQVNALKIPLNWHCLSDVVRRSYRQREVSPDSAEIEMYANDVLIENRSERAKSYFIRRREHDHNSIKSLHSGSRCVSWNSVGDYIEFKVDLASAESTLPVLRFKAAEAAPRSTRNFAYVAKTMLRRYLSEARDNYLAPAKARMVAFSRS